MLDTKPATQNDYIGKPAPLANFPMLLNSSPNGRLLLLTNLLDAIFFL